jgi:hypothetical protein
VADLTTLRKQSRKKARRANKKVAPIASDARDTAVRTAETTRDWAAPKVEAARDWAGPRVEPAVTRVKDDVLPKVAGAVAAALAASEPAREEAMSRGTAALAALKGEVEAPKARKHRLRRLFLLAGLVGAAVAAWKAWNAQAKVDHPEPWVAAAPAPGTSPRVIPTDDPAGASPDEALADAAEAVQAADLPAAEVADVPPTTEPVSPEQSTKVDKAAGTAKKAQTAKPRPPSS